MAKLSELFGRRADEAGPSDAITPLDVRPGNGNETAKPHTGAAQTIESLTEVGSRIGEENEVLRNLLSDTGRKISELEGLKQAFDKLVTPFNATLRALEQEKSKTLSLSGMLEESRAGYERLRVEFYELEKRASAAETESEQAREELERARETTRTLESLQLGLSDEVKERQNQIVELERQLAQESAQRRSLSDGRRSFQEQIDAAEKHLVELEGDLAATREKLASTRASPRIPASPAA
jgi:crescentin